MLLKRILVHDKDVITAKTTYMLHAHLLHPAHMLRKQR